MIKNSILIGISFLISKILGLYRETLLATNFGISALNPHYNLDAYFAAFKLPDFIFNIVSSGVISAAFIPLFVEYLTKHDLERARRFASDSMYILSIFVATASVILFIGARYFVQLLVPGFSGELLESTIQLTRLMLVVPLIFTISGVLNGVNNSLNHYKGMALAPIFYNQGIISGILLWGKEYGIVGVAWGVIIGSLCCLAVQIPEAIKGGFRVYRFQNLWNEHTRRLFSLAIPRIGGMSITQLSLFADTFLASLLPIGSLTYINLAGNLYFVPVGIVGVSIAVTHFSHMSVLALKDDMSDFAASITAALRTVLFLLIPTTIGMILISKPLVTLLFMHGVFTSENVELTAKTLQVFSFGIVGTSLVQILARAFYALKNTKTPLVVGAQAFTLNFIVGYFAAFYFNLQTLGLAVATAFSSTVYCILLIIQLQKKLKHESLFPWKESAKYLTGSLVMGMVGVAITKQVETLPLAQYASAIELSAVILVCALSYALCMHLLKSTEFALWKSKILARISKNA